MFCSVGDYSPLIDIWQFLNSSAWRWSWSFISVGSSYQQIPINAPWRANNAQLQMSFLGFFSFIFIQASYGPTFAKSASVKMPISFRLFAVLAPMFVSLVSSDI